MDEIFLRWSAVVVVAVMYGEFLTWVTMEKT